MLHRRRRIHNATAAGAAFLALAVVFLVFNDVTVDGYEVFITSSAAAASSPEIGCRELQKLEDDAARCRYLRTHPPCSPEGYIDYLRLLYCGFGRRSPSPSSPPAMGFVALGLWLLVLFYLLGDTASEYFCASLEGLSAVLRLPPAIAGVTLLSLGNGAPDVLSSVVAFASGGDDGGDVGLSGVIGGALFVSTVVAGVVSIVSSRRRDAAAVVIERRGFVRDVCFLLVAICYLLAVMLTGAVSLLAAVSFLSLYAAYVLLVSASHCCASDDDAIIIDDDVTKIPNSHLTAPLLLIDDDDDVIIDTSPPPPHLLPVSSSTASSTRHRTLARRAADVIASPLYLPRRLTIPDVAEHRWSKPTAVVTSLLSPILLAAITLPATLAAAAVAGVVLAAATAVGTDADSPPKSRRSRLPFLAGGFAMSVLWSYLLAGELVSLLVSIGVAAGVEPGVLGATVLAWGNSMGDLVANVALASGGGGGGGGAETAVAGCYAGPAFNTVVGLGMSLTVAAAARRPEPYDMPATAAVYVAVAFLAAALVWALVVLPARGMRLDAVFGGGLIVIYFVFLCVRLAILTPIGLT
uniref:Sodium/calcium exchanger membrane region domain-containing protein n=1 Tax=Leersia perrieri TaxID=77586 RepID=A0A0D9Y1K1_9ORYZ